MPLHENILARGGTADGSACNRAALERARRANLAIAFPCTSDQPAVYRFDGREPIHLRNNETWIGGGRKTCLLSFPDLEGTDQAVIGHRNCLLQNLSLFGPGDHALAGVGAKGIGFSDQGLRSNPKKKEWLARHILSNVEIRGFAEGVRTTFTWIAKYTDCYVVQCTIGYHHTAPSDNPLGQANAIYWEGGEFQANGKHVLLDTETNLVSFHGVEFEDGPESILIRGTTSSTGAKRGVRVKNCHFERNVGPDIDVDGYALGLVIRDNFHLRFGVPPLAIRITNANGTTRRAVVADNFIENNNQVAATIEIGEGVSGTHIEGNSVTSGLPAVIDDNGSATRIVG